MSLDILTFVTNFGDPPKKLTASFAGLLVELLTHKWAEFLQRSSAWWDKAGGLLEKLQTVFEPSIFGGDVVCMGSVILHCNIARSS